MKRLFLNLMLVLALAAGTGFAFANQDAPALNTLKAKINGVWTPISVSTEYSCEYRPNEECTAEFDQQDHMIPETLVEGRFVAE